MNYVGRAVAPALIVFTCNFEIVESYLKFKMMTVKKKGEAAKSESLMQLVVPFLLAGTGTKHRICDSEMNLKCRGRCVNSFQKLFVQDCQENATKLVLQLAHPCRL